MIDYNFDVYVYVDIFGIYNWNVYISCIYSCFNSCLL